MPDRPPPDSPPSLRPRRGIGGTASGIGGPGRRAGRGLVGGTPVEPGGVRRRLRIAAALLLGAFVAFLTRHLFLEDFGLNQLFDAGWQRWAVIAVLAGVVGWLSAPLPLPNWGLGLCEALTFGVPGAFFLWVHQHGLANAPPEVRPLLAASYPGAVAAPWMLLIQVFALFVPTGTRRAAAVIGMMAALPLVGACATAAQFPELRAVLFGQGLFSAMMVWIGLSAATALYGAVKLTALRRAARQAREVGAYRLKERIGSGGMGEVYLAEHRLLRRPCAVKLIRTQLAEDDRALARFDSEVRAAARLTHPNTIEIYDFGVTDAGRFYCAMEYLPGLTLHDVALRGGPLPPGRVVRLLEPVCGALAEAHGRGLIHRDVKPANIIAATRGGVHDVPKLLDFGLVKQVGPEWAVTDGPAPSGGGPEEGDLTDETDADLELTQEGTMVGSPLFAAPETAYGDGPTAASDLYSLGATAYFLLTGRPVFDEPNAMRALFAHANTPPVDVCAANPAVPADLGAVVMTCLRKAPADRFGSAAALAAALRACGCAGDWTAADADAWWAALEGVPSSRHPLVFGGNGGTTGDWTPADGPGGAPDGPTGEFVLRDGDDGGDGFETGLGLMPCGPTNELPAVRRPAAGRADAPAYHPAAAP